MYIVTHLPELSIWVTDNPFDKRSGTWMFYDEREYYEDELFSLKKKYGTKRLYTLKKIEQLYKNRNVDKEEY